MFTSPSGSLDRGLVSRSLPGADIDLWIVDDTQIQDAKTLRSFSRWLTPEEGTRWRRFQFEKDRHQHLVCRAFVRSVLSSYHESLLPEDWSFGANEYGRPSLQDPPSRLADLRFNISHTRGCIVIAVSMAAELGVDVENTTRSGNTVELARHSFSSREVSDLEGLPANEQTDRFFDLWTLKESYIKARGMGLSIPLKSFAFVFSESGSVVLEVAPECDDTAEGWRFWQFAASGDHKVAIAQRGARNDLSRMPRVTVLDTRELEPPERGAYAFYRRPIDSSAF